ERLVSGARGGQQLPFRYYSAYRAVQELGGKGSPRVLDALEECLMASLGALPYFPGRTMALADNSGSAQSTAPSAMGEMKISTIGNLTGILAGLVSDEGHLGIFGDRLETLPIRRKGSVFQALEAAEERAQTIGTSTENGIWLFWDQAIRR